MTALHRVYLEVTFFIFYFMITVKSNFYNNNKPEGPIYSSLITFVKNPNDMSLIFEDKSPIFEECVNFICQNVEEIVIKFF